MENEKKLRLIQVAKEFKVGLNTITDFLHRKGVTIEASPNARVDAATYAILEKEYGANRSSRSERDSVREKISQKQTTISIEEPKEEPAKRTIEVKNEIVQPKILGKIDLGGPKKTEQPKAEEPKVEVSTRIEQPKAEEPKVTALKSVEQPKTEAPQSVEPKSVEVAQTPVVEAKTEPQQPAFSSFAP